jgi:hypothetical protein
MQKAAAPWERLRLSNEKVYDIKKGMCRAHVTSGFYKRSAHPRDRSG